MKVTSASMRASPSLMCLSIVFDAALPTMKNSLRLAWAAAASEPMFWSSSWLKTASSFGAAASRLAIACWPDCTVNGR